VKLIDKMNRKLKKNKSLYVFSDGCFFFSTSSFLYRLNILEKDFKNYEFFIKNSYTNISEKTNDKFKYRGKLLKKNIK